jgi:hypothetical protein
MLGSTRTSESGRGTLTTLGIEDLLTERPTLAIPRLGHNAQADLLRKQQVLGSNPSVGSTPATGPAHRRVRRRECAGGQRRPRMTRPVNAMIRRDVDIVEIPPRSVQVRVTLHGVRRVVALLCVLVPPLPAKRIARKLEPPVLISCTFPSSLTVCQTSPVRTRRVHNGSHAEPTTARRPYPDPRRRL